MCGIVGAVSQRDVSKILLEGLRRLEYRGYDSAGVAVIDTDTGLKRLRTLGKVQVLADVMQETSLVGHAGVAHTRWATHGQPSEMNAHPHISEELALVHNGIIENYEQLRLQLIEKGYRFTSETDTEVAVHLMHYYYMEHNDLLLAVQKAAAQMQGAFAFAVIHQYHPDMLVVYRKGSPLVIGLGVGENFIASDTLALRSFAQSVIYLEEGDSACISHESVQIYDASNQLVTRKTHALNMDYDVAGKGDYRHFMLKEIMEQTQVLTNTLEGRIGSLPMLRASFGIAAQPFFDKVQQIHIVACGTSYHAGLIAKTWLESLTKLPTQVEIASEYRYRDVVVLDNTLFIAVSQSGETADTLAALYKAREMHYLGTLAICNVPTSTLVREADCSFLTRAGLEIGVASTKAFTTQLTAFLMLAAALCPDKKQAQEVLKQLQTLPASCAHILEKNAEIAALAPLFVGKAHSLFLGRGAQYPVALEGALKLKEISYIHAEAYPAGELKHGALALVDENMPVIAVVPKDLLLDKLKSNLQEVVARGGQLFLFIDETCLWEGMSGHFISMPSVGSWIAPIIYTIPLQLLAYYVAVARGTDVDQPRNLAKSVTVE